MTLYTSSPRISAGGCDIGIILIDDQVPFAPGDVGNARTYDYPVMYEVATGVTAKQLTDPDESTVAVESIIDAARRLEQSGVRAITSGCGYMLRHQKEVADAVSIPVLLSSLLQLPLMDAALGAGKSIGVICANSNGMTQDLLALAYPGGSRPIHIRGLEKQPAFHSAFLEETGRLDTSAVEREVVAIARSLIDDEPEVGALLLECSNLPPYAASVHEATGRAVFDYVSMIDYLSRSVRPRSYSD